VVGDRMSEGEVIKMARIKQEVLAMIERLPDEASLDEIMAELYFRMQVDAGVAELEAGQGIQHEEVERRVSKWLGE
jgi:predicted transcriptional regulator